MKTPSLFVSSTCHDLHSERNAVKALAESMGLEPILSESEPFPVDPDKTTVDNCLNVITKKADILVLILGGRYGSVAESGKSITHLEFLAAKEKGIPVYVLISRAVFELLPLWRSAQEVDHSLVADSPKLLDFAKSLIAEGNNWVFPFESAHDITNILRHQLGYLFMDSLQLRLKASKCDDSLIGILQGRALRLSIEQPLGWEYLLMGHTLSDELRKLEDRKRDWAFGITRATVREMNSVEFVQWIGAKLPEAKQLEAMLANLFEKAIPAAIGTPGVSGDPRAILYVATRFALIYESVLQWKLDFVNLELPSELCRLKTVTSQLCDNMVSEIEEFCKNYNHSVMKAVEEMKAGRTAEVSLILKPTLRGLGEFEQEMQRVANNVRFKTPS